ncbi:TIGR00730 family Rossman fold protein [Peristeroidobacter agariperforans]|uniref:TIGR00730 family Rossman fold protein n=1 Tax=Peristeroidobacter agariperforans TaxID=268404 RepID=UPI00101D5D2C|nr:TIGR00730 family Rossman fold protein [Peristeroidobacter agariperforans]
MRSICVFCGSSPGNRPEYMDLARATGRLIAERQLTLVYGGGKVGLMGALADAALAAGGRVIGIIPQMLLDREAGHRGLTELRVVSSLSERKFVMGVLSDAFLSLPGGIGTLDELFEAWSWFQLGLHKKPSGLLNFQGYYDHLVQFLDLAVTEGFQNPRHRAALLVGTEIESLLDQLMAASQGAPST